MGEVSTIGLDIAKSVFHVHGVDAAGAVVIRKRVSRAKMPEYFGELPPCLVGIEACRQHITGAASFRGLVTRSG
jgi:transposase